MLFAALNVLIGILLLSSWKFRKSNEHQHYAFLLYLYFPYINIEYKVYSVQRYKKEIIFKHYLLKKRNKKYGFYVF